MNWGIVEVIIAVLILSSSGVMVRWAGINTGTMTFFRTGVPSLVLGLWLIGQRRSNRRNKKSTRAIAALCIASILNAFRLWLYFEAFRRTSMGNVVIVLYTWPIHAMILGAIFLKEPISRSDFLLLFLAFIGMGIVYSGGSFSFDNNDFIGMSLMLVSASLYALMIVLIRKQSVDRVEATFWQNIAGAILFAPAFIQNAGDIPIMSWTWSVLNGILVGIVAFILIFSAYRRLSAAVVGHIAYLEVIFGLLWGLLIFNEPIDWRHYCGGGLIVLSMIIRAEILHKRSIL